MSAGNDPGAMRKMPDYFGLVEDDRQDDDRYDEYGDMYEAGSWSSQWQRPPHPDGPVSDGPDERESLEELFGAVFDLADQIASRISPETVEVRLRRALREATPRIMTLHPRTYNELRTIGEHFREGTPVIMNLTEMVGSDARRLVDFAAGLIFGLRGSIDKVTNKVFLLSPADVEITAEDKARIGAGIIPGEMTPRRTGPEEVEARLRRVPPGPGPQIMTLHPRTYNEARTIGEHFREGTPVIMNLTEMVDSDARRLVDFAAGLIFGLRGSIDRVTNKVFLLSPANVEITAEDKARIAERGFFGQT